MASGEGFSLHMTARSRGMVSLRLFEIVTDNLKAYERRRIPGTQSSQASSPVDHSPFEVVSEQCATAPSLVPFSSLSLKASASVYRERLRSRRG